MANCRICGIKLPLFADYGKCNNCNRALERIADQTLSDLEVRADIERLEKYIPLIQEQTVINEVNQIMSFRLERQKVEKIQKETEAKEYQRQQDEIKQRLAQIQQSGIVGIIITTTDSISDCSIIEYRKILSVTIPFDSTVKFKAVEMHAYQQLEEEAIANQANAVIGVRSTYAHLSQTQSGASIRGVGVATVTSQMLFHLTGTAVLIKKDKL